VLDFTGTNVAVIANRDDASGETEILTDGQRYKTLSLASATAQADQIIAKRGWEPAAAHTVTVKALAAGSVGLGGFVVLTDG
jgi:hypothetical protein